MLPFWPHKRARTHKKIIIIKILLKKKKKGRKKEPTMSMIFWLMDQRPKSENIAVFLVHSTKYTIDLEIDTLKEKDIETFTCKHKNASE